MATAVAATLVAVVAVVVTIVVCRAAWERSSRRRLAAVVDSLPGVTPPAPDATFDDVLAGIDRAARRLVTDRRGAEEDAARLRAAFEGVPHAVLVFDGEGALVASNPAAAPFLQARHGDALVGAAVSEVVARAAMEGTAATTIELFGPPRRVVDVTAVQLVDGAAGVVATVEDVSERRHLEEVRTDLVANISHELKTPVGAIGLLAETIEDEDDPEVVARLATRINGEAMRLAAIVDDLLDLARIESSTGAPGAPVALDAVVAEAVDRLGAVSERVGVTLVPRVGERSVTVLGDRTQLVSALANLVDNALKYSDRGDEVEVLVAFDGDEASLVVSDNGMGIPTRDLDRIFERFYRVDQARSRDTGGSGLGLSIVRHVAANHGGRVEVRSRLGEGSTFTIVLPRATAGTGATP